MQGPNVDSAAPPDFETLMRAACGKCQVASTPKGSIQLSFRLPVSGVAVDAVGSLIWEHNKRHGIRFTYVGAQSRLSILQCVRVHAKH
jgi:hypothetical protein